MEFNSYSGLSSEYSNAHKIAARELIKYCQEFDSWYEAGRRMEVRAQDLRGRGMLVPHTAGGPAPPERHLAH